MFYVSWVVCVHVRVRDYISICYCERILRSCISKSDFLLGQFRLVLIRDGEVVQLIYFLLFDRFNLSPLLINLLSHLSALLQVVKSLLLALLLVVHDLSSQLGRVLLEHVLLLLLDPSLLLLNLLLLLDDSQKLISLLLSLFS